MEQPSREELVDRLAGVSHASWIRQKARDGVPHDQLETAITGHDGERAEDVVQELERLGVYPRARRRAELAKTLRHPLVVGGALTLLSGLIASLLIPGLTRVWQDRPKELALKRSLVKEISKVTTTAIDDAKFTDIRTTKALTDDQTNARFSRMARRWDIESSLVTTELTTYFHRTAVLRHWRAYSALVRRYIRATASRRWIGNDGVAASQDPDLVALLKRYDPTHRDFYPFVDRIPEAIPKGLFAERDELAAEIVETPATGFSHGWWIFK
jgi:hypothetical protein